MKAYTDIEQSRKFAEILPVESADMCYIKGKAHLGFLYKEYKEFGDSILQEYEPCWSLAALLDQLGDRISDEEYNQWELVLKKEDVQYDIYYLNIWGEQDNIEIDRFYDDLIDCCYDMIIKLKEKDLL